MLPRLRWISPTSCDVLRVRLAQSAAGNALPLSGVRRRWVTCICSSRVAGLSLCKSQLGETLSFQQWAAVSRKAGDSALDLAVVPARETWPGALGGCESSTAQSPLHFRPRRKTNTSLWLATLAHTRPRGFRP